MSEDLARKRKREDKVREGYDTVYFVNHSHMDNTWGGTPEECLEKNLDILGEVLEVCKEHPDFYFSQESVYPLHEFVKKHPARVGEVTDLIKAGRLEVGAEYVQPIVDYCFDECIVRNLYYGKGWLKRSFGYDTRLAYEEDVPGHTFQMPQVLRRSGVKYFKISRGPQSIFYWESLDGSAVLTYLAEYSWSHHALLGESPEETLRRLPQELEKAKWNYKIRNLMIPDGDDWTPPNPKLLEIAQSWNEKIGRPKLKVGTIHEFLSSVEKDDRIPGITGDMPNIWVGVSAIEAETIRRLRAIQNLIFAAEEFTAISSLLGGGQEVGDLEEAWRLILLTADHNWGGKDPSKHGEFSDEEKLRYIKKAKTICKKQLGKGIESIASKIDTTFTKAEEVPLVVFNQLPWVRTDVVEFEVDSATDPSRIRVQSHDGTYIASQATILSETEGKKRIRVTFIAEDVPPVGYKTYFINFNIPSPRVDTLLKTEENVLENRYFRIEIDPKGRGIARLLDKERGIEIGGERQCTLGPMKFSFMLNEIFGLGLRLNIKKVPTVKDRATDLITADPTGEVFRSGDYPCPVTAVEDGPVKATIQIEGKFMNSMKRQEVTIYDKLKRIDLRTTVEWLGKNFVAVMMMFPLNVNASSMVVSVPYGAVDLTDVAPGFWVKPTDQAQFKVRGIQHWVDVADSGGGATILTNWPCFDFTMAPAAVALWSMDSERSFFSGERYRQKGIHTLTFSLVPHKGGWRMSKTYRQGLDIAFPLISLITSQHSASLPKEMSFVVIDASNIVLTALKKAEDKQGLIIRMYEAEGLEKNLGIELSDDIKECWETNLLEENVKKLTFHERRVDLSISPYEIKTVRVLFVER